MQILFPPFQFEAKAMNNQDEYIYTNNFDYGTQPKLDIICNMILVLLIEYDTVIEVTGAENSELMEEFFEAKTIGYYVMKDGSVDEYKAIFERYDMPIQHHDTLLDEKY